MKAGTESIRGWTQDPETVVPVIIHVRGAPRQYVDAITGHNLSVDRVFRLTNTIAARGPARSVLDLLEEPWVAKIEPDRQMRAMD